MMDDLELLIDLHQDAARQGPGSDAETSRAIELAGLKREQPLKVADIGCGTGASTLVLARALNAQITAVDFVQAFLDVLVAEAQRQGLAEQITTRCCAMDALPFETSSLDLIWSEGAIYNIGFEKGIAEWRPYLKPGGLLAVSEITWTTGARPMALQQHWQAEYPEIDVASAKMRVLEQHGYSPVGYFVLPEHCWLDHYYRPLEQRFQRFLDRHQQSAEARSLVAAEQQEIALYEQYRAFFSYGFYLARKLD